MTASTGMPDGPVLNGGYGGTAPSVAGLGDDSLHPTPGRQGVVMAALTIGLLMMAIQLWLLTVSLELFLAGHGERCWLLALVSGAIFAGGLFMLRLLDRRPRLGAGHAPAARLR
jgi:hypothetical protein